MRHLLAILLLGLSLTALAAELRTFDLRYRSAEELIPVLRPMIDPDGSLSGTGYILIVRSSRENIEQIATLVEQLDQIPQQLLITVKQEEEQHHLGSGAELSSPPSERRISARAYSAQRDKTGNIGQQLRVSEGNWATIRAGESIPQVVQEYRHSPGGSTVEHRIEYRDVDSGFEVRPRVHGDQVTLEIRPFRAKLSNSDGGIIEQQSLYTTVTGKLGQWLELGGHSRQQKQDERGIVYSTNERDELLSNIRLKVERINQ